ncbi:DUF2946 family protein [Azospirillum brasilense]|uniref:DUF2946 domain-containing protein n=2 Tax=Azospirillum TaxID=191 RepID=A0A6L3B2E9_AZOBR|nr:DUF2946 domain-containing protein [Azospirillum brasilense]
MSALAVVLLLLRILLPAVPGGTALAGPDDGTFHAGPAHAHLGQADHSGETDRHHEICHFCRFQDAVLPPPTSEPVARTLPPVVAPWLPSARQAAPALDFLVVVQARAPPRFV